MNALERIRRAARITWANATGRAPVYERIPDPEVPVGAAYPNLARALAERPGDVRRWVHLLNAAGLRCLEMEITYSYDPRTRAVICGPWVIRRTGE